MDFFVYQRIKYDLGEAFPIPKVDENHPTVIPAAMDPAHQNHFFINVICTKLPAMMRSAHVT
jgi:hypothetical protein